MAYVGDDWVDVGPMEVVGLPMAVANAQPEIMKLALWTSQYRGGHGAVREAIRFILESQNALDRLWRTWAD
jgi:3-deoxy-D-manno-octulosonate 8-phosphate phosphatase (KDO 8-P phosphatase)